MRIFVIFVALVTASVSWAGPFGQRFSSGGGCASGNCSAQDHAQSYAQPGCAGGNCSRQYAQPQVFNGWFENPVNGSMQLAQYKDGKCVGAFVIDGEYFMSYNEDTKEWGGAVYDLPADLPAKYKLPIESKQKAATDKKRLEFESKQKVAASAQAEREKIEATLKEVEAPKRIDVASDSNGIPEWMKSGVELSKPRNPDAWKFNENSYIINGQVIPEGSFTGPDEQGICPDTQNKNYLTAFAKDPAMREKIKRDFSKFKGSDKVWSQVLSPDSWQAETHKLSESKKFDADGVCYFYQGPKGKDNFSKPIWAEFGYMTPEDIGRKIDKDFHPDDVPSSSRGGNGGGVPFIPLACGGVILFAVFSKKSEE